jgi:hypothetical protein
MAKRRQKKATTVTAILPSSMELSRLGTKDSLNIEVRRGDELLGTLAMGKGSVAWWPKGNSVHCFRKRWRPFANMLDRYMKEKDF